MTGSAADNVTPGIAPCTYALVTSRNRHARLVDLQCNGSYGYTLTSPFDADRRQQHQHRDNVESFTYRVTDAAGNTATGTITVNVTDDVPTAQANTNSVVEGAIVTGNVLTEASPTCSGRTARRQRCRRAAWSGLRPATTRLCRF